MEIIRGKLPGAKKTVVYGPEGIGKSTFASRFPDPLFIDTEGSTKDMDVARTPTPSSWAMLLEQIAYIRDNPSICKTLVVDTIDWAEQMCVEHICSLHQKKGVEDFGYGKGYVYVKEEFGRFLNRLTEVVRAGVNVVLTAHTQIRKFTQPDELGDYDRYELKLGQKTQSQTSPLVKEWADMLLFANYKTYSVAVDDKGKKHKAQGGKRVMYTSHHPCWDAKNRYGLPEEVPFEYESVAHIIQDNIAPAQRQIPAQTSPKAETAKEDMYFYHPESDAVWMLKKGEELPTGIDTGMSVGISKEEYEKKLEQNTPPAESEKRAFSDSFRDIPDNTPEQMTMSLNGPAAREAPENDKDSALHIDERIPKPLRDLMVSNSVQEDEIAAVVEARGYVPIGTPIWEYDTANPGIIEGLLVASWAQVYGAVKEMRENQEIPF